VPDDLKGRVLAIGGAMHEAFFGPVLAQRRAWTTQSRRCVRVTPAPASPPALAVAPYLSANPAQSAVSASAPLSAVAEEQRWRLTRCAEGACQSGQRKRERWRQWVRHAVTRAWRCCCAAVGDDYARWDVCTPVKRSFLLLLLLQTPHTAASQTISSIAHVPPSSEWRR
jgi:hypothetical protein